MGNEFSASWRLARWLSTSSRSSAKMDLGSEAGMSTTLLVSASTSMKKSRPTRV
ncbi:hypothetical protein ACFPRL_02180 [Pseudoclavibacter helvolus]